MTDTEAQLRIRVSVDTHIPAAMHWQPNQQWIEGECPPWSWLVAGPANEAPQ